MKKKKLDQWLLEFPKREHYAFLVGVVVGILIMFIGILLSGCAQYIPSTHTIMASPFTSAEFPTDKGVAKIDTKVVPTSIIVK